MKRIEKNDPVAMCRQAGKYYDKEDYSSAFEYWTKAAKLGDVEAHYKLGCLSTWPNFFLLISKSSILDVKIIPKHELSIKTHNI